MTYRTMTCAQARRSVPALRSAWALALALALAAMLPASPLAALPAMEQPMAHRSVVQLLALAARCPAPPAHLTMPTRWVSKLLGARFVPATRLHPGLGRQCPLPANLGLAGTASQHVRSPDRSARLAARPARLDHAHLLAASDIARTRLLVPGRPDATLPLHGMPATLAQRPEETFDRAGSQRMMPILCFARTRSPSLERMPPPWAGPGRLSRVRQPQVFGFLGVRVAGQVRASVRPAWRPGARLLAKARWRMQAS